MPYGMTAFIVGEIKLLEFSGGEESNLKLCGMMVCKNTPIKELVKNMRSIIESNS